MANVELLDYAASMSLRMDRLAVSGVYATLSDEDQTTWREMVALTEAAFGR